MESLPIDPQLPRITDALRAASSLVVIAEPGAGKTTRLPPAIVRANLLPSQHPSLVMLQPRRVAARTAAMRIAQENGWSVGDEVGYHVRFDRRVSRRTRIRILTEGILTRQLIDDPSLEGIGCVILDEFHERSLNTDIAIALLREVQQTIREDLRIIVMSATIDAAPIARYLGGCPVIDVPGRTFGVEIVHRPTRGGELEDEMASALQAALESAGTKGAIAPDAATGGDVLMFLPGAEEIRRTMQAVAPIARAHRMEVVPLHGTLDAQQQLRAVMPGDRNRVICATNIAETSLTIPGVRTVIDSGLMRSVRFDAHRGIDRLELVAISKASAAQRAGRAGRVAPGRCVRLWSEKQHGALADFEAPEVLRVDLSATVLALSAWGRHDAREFAWLTRPSDDAIVRAERLLRLLGALDANRRVTALGRRMLNLPLHPRLARMLAGASAELRNDACSIAAILGEKDFLVSERARSPSTRSRSDVLIRLESLNRQVGSRPARGSEPVVAGEVDGVALQHVVRVRDELLRLTDPVADGHAADRAGKSVTVRASAPAAARSGEIAAEDRRLKLILLAYPDRVCLRRASDRQSGVMVGGAGVRLASESTVVDGDLFVAVDLFADDRSMRGESRVRIASWIEHEWLGELFPQSVSQRTVAEYDESRSRVVARRLSLYSDLVIQSSVEGKVDPAEAGRVLFEALRTRAAEIVAGNEDAASILSRIQILRQSIPEAGFPEIAPEHVLERACENQRELRDLDLAGAVQSLLPYPLDRQLEEWAPRFITVPSGSRIKLRYEAKGSPVLAVRLQELFGLPDTPRIAAGRVPVLIHLLGPNYRPVQVTSDLRSFWNTTYHQVRKDLRAKYPKHSWPDDPWSAPPQAKGSRRR